MNRILVRNIRVLMLCAAVAACAGPRLGPDKQFGGSLRGAATGAGAGAVTGFQLGVGTGPGAAVGAGVGAVAGGVQGFLLDRSEERMLQLAAQTGGERQRALIHEVLSDHYNRRLELHPSRDIFPADLFFYGDQSRLRPDALMLVEELARLNRERLPWSRLVLVVYALAKDENSAYGQRLTQRRSQELFNYFVRAGIEPRRIEARGVLLSEPLVIDPNDRPDRYSQAVEIMALDR